MRTRDRAPFAVAARRIDARGCRSRRRYRLGPHIDNAPRIAGFSFSGRCTDTGRHGPQNRLDRR